MTKKFLYIAAFIIPAFAFGSYVQEYQVKYITTNQGLSQNEVKNIIQDSKGFMWFTTRAGVNRYDGREFIQFNTGTSSEYNLSNPSIECILEDSNNNLWIGTKSGGLNFFNYSKEQFTQILQFGSDSLPIRDKRIININETPDGKMLIGTWSDGLYVLDYDQNKLNHILNDTKIYSILPTSGNQVWLGTNKGLVLLNIDDYSYELIKIDNQFEVIKIIFDGNEDHIWLAGWSAGLTHLNTKTLEYKRYSLNNNDKSYDTPENSTYSLLLDSNGKLWVGTWNGGLYTFDRESKHFTKFDIAPSGLSDLNTNFNIVLDIYEDENKNIWIGTDSGGVVFLGAKKSFHGISFDKHPDCGLKNFYITSIYETPDKTLWLGTRGGGLYKTTDKKIFEQIPIENETFESLIIKYIYPIEEDFLLVSTGKNLYFLDLQKNQILKPFTNQLLSQIVKVLCVFRSENHLFLGTQHDGFYFIENYFSGGTEVTHFNPQNNEVIKNTRITFIKKDKNNKVWVGTYRGVYLFDIKTNRLHDVRLTTGALLNSEMTFCWEETQDGIIWLGTPQGLVKLKETKNQTFNARFYYNENIYPFKFVRHILADNLDNIWLSTGEGLIRFDIETEAFVSFDKSNGLLDLNYSEDVSFKGEDGTFYLGGGQGLNYFNPAEIKLNSNVPPLVFTKLEIYGKEIKPGEKVNGKVIYGKTICQNPTLVLSHKEKEFTIEFAALSYDAPGKNYYKYKLEGYDLDWISSGNRRSATYNNLSGDTYKLMVMGSNNNNVWNEQPISLTIRVKSAPWASWYAFVTYILLIFGMVMLIIRNSTKQLNLSNSLKMQKLKSEQEHNLNEMKLRFFTNISHEFRTPLTMIMAPIKEVLKNYPDNQRLNVAYKNSKRLIGLVNQLLEFRRIETDNVSLKVSENNIADFIEEIYLSYEELAIINEIRIEKQLNISSHLLWFDIEKVEIALNNIISNAFKYAGSGSKIKLAVDETKDFVNFRISDNGPGIEVGELDKIFDRFYQSGKNKNFESSGIGLDLAKKMIELHSGKIAVESSPFVKTEFTIQLLKGTAHFPEESLVKSPTTRSYKKKESQFDTVQNLPNQITGAKSLSMLVVEDNAEIRVYLKELFEEHFNVIEAGNGLQGLNQAQETEIDIVISDIMMPEMDGLEMCRTLKTDIKTSHLPIILLTAKSARQFRIEGLEHGADAYISKPFDPDELRLQVNTILESRRKAIERYNRTILIEPSELKIVPFEEKFLKEVISVIEDNIENPEFTSEILAKSVGLSTSSLYRKLKTVVGQSSNELIRTIRLKRAAQIIISSNETISEITYSLGFNDIKYFRKCFQKQFGKTPNQYRKDHISMPIN